MISVSFLLLLGCAKVSKAPESSSDEAKLFNTVEGKSVVYLYREKRAVGAAVQYMVKINGIDAGGTGPGTFFRWELKPGTYSIASSSTESSATVQVNAEAGKLYFFKQIGRLGFESTRLSIKEVDEKTGKKDIQGLKLLVSSYIPE
jgi:hypothetical protein